LVVTGSAGTLWLGSALLSGTTPSAPSLKVDGSAFAVSSSTGATGAAVSTMRRVLHEGQTPRPLQEKATK
jgi:hypothetical protein